MKSLRFAGNSKIEVIAVPEPKPTPDQVVINIKVSALCGSEMGAFYSPNGLRLNDGPNGARDDRGIQANESAANYYAVVGLEPEQISLCLTTQGAFTDFLLLKKPLGIDQGGVRHKGGSVLRSTDSGFDCLLGWASGQVDKAKCDDAVMQ